MEERQDFSPGPGYINVDSVFRHGLVHAVGPELRRSPEFLIAPGESAKHGQLVGASVLCLIASDALADRGALPTWGWPRPT